MGAGAGAGTGAGERAVIGAVFRQQPTVIKDMILKRLAPLLSAPTIKKKAAKSRAARASDTRCCFGLCT
jgi:hypothetical protein